MAVTVFSSGGGCLRNKVSFAEQRKTENFSNKLFQRKSKKRERVQGDQGSWELRLENVCAEAECDSCRREGTKSVAIMQRSRTGGNLPEEAWGDFAVGSIFLPVPMTPSSINRYCYHNPSNAQMKPDTNSTTHILKWKRSPQIPIHTNKDKLKCKR